ncbi:MAG: ABC transporter permease subunit [Propionibacteriales bacterium]|nr:ABC transporter permease subunit [Propionibacteriales bacterium]
MASRRSVPQSLLLHGTLLLATLIALLPVLWVLASSFKPASRILSSEIRFVDQPTLDNYTRLLTETDFPRWLLNSVIVAVFTMVFGVFMSASAGYAMSRFNFPGRRGLMWTFLVTQMFPVAILIVPIYTIMSALGLINTLTSLVIAYCTVAVPFCAWMLKGYFDTIPRDLDEAAALDGLGPFATFWRVILPLARPGLAVTMFYTFLTAWGEVAYATAFLQTDNKFTLGYGLQTFVPQFNKQWEYLTPAAILITIPAALVFLFAQRHLVGGLAAGATKG